MKRRLGLTLYAIAMLAAGCAAGDSEPTSAAEGLETEALAGGSFRIQSGKQLTVLGVTDDDHAIYQDGTTVYATGLFPGSRRELTTETGAAVGSQNPLVFISGNVAFIWPDNSFFGSSVSRLIVWTAAGGARLATDASLGQSWGVAASPDSRQVVFIANASVDGTVGDLVAASVDSKKQLTLVAGVKLDAVGVCMPQVGFDRKPRVGRDHDDDRDDVRRGRAAHPVAGYCLAGSTTAVLSRWIDGHENVLATDVHGFPQWSTDTTGEKIFTLVGSPPANQRPVSIGPDGTVSVLEDVFTGGGTINTDDTIMTFARPGAVFEMHHFLGRPPTPRLITPMGRPFSIFFNQGRKSLRDYTIGFTSGTGWALFGNPTASGFNLFIVDTKLAPSPLVPIQQDQNCGPSTEPFSADSDHALLYCADPTFGVALFDASTSGVIRPLSTGSAGDFTSFAVDDNVITFADDLVFPPANPSFPTVNIKLVDLDAETLAPRTIAPEAYTFYWPSADRRRIVYTSDHDAKAPGLFVARVR